MAGLPEILTAIQNGVTAVNNLSTTIASIFPQTVVLSSIAPSGGTLTFTSSLAASFMSVTTSSGASYKIPLY